MLIQSINSSREANVLYFIFSYKPEIHSRAQILGFLPRVHAVGQQFEAVAIELQVVESAITVIGANTWFRGRLCGKGLACRWEEH